MGLVLCKMAPGDDSDAFLLPFVQVATRPGYKGAWALRPIPYLGSEDQVTYMALSKYTRPKTMIR